MTQKTTTIGMPKDPAETAEFVAHGRGIRLNTLVPETLEAAVGRVNGDGEFMDQLCSLAGRDKETLDRLAL